MGKQGGLCVTLREDEQVYIGDDICITVRKYTDSQIRIRIEAPRDLKISRITRTQEDKKVRAWRKQDVN